MKAILIYIILLLELFLSSINGLTNNNDYAIKRSQPFTNYEKIYQENTYGPSLINTRSIQNENNACHLNIDCSGKILNDFKYIKLLNTVKIMLLPRYRFRNVPINNLIGK